MKNKLILLSVVAWLCPAEAMNGPAVDAVVALTAKKNELALSEYGDLKNNDASHNKAREITRQLLNPSATRFATADEKSAIVDAHLKTELYYAFNTKGGTGKARNHRILYDFIDDFQGRRDQGGAIAEHMTIITALSLAAQEYFWNNKSTVEDLKNHVRRELRYGLFKQTDHRLNVVGSINLDEENPAGVLNRVINTWVTGELLGKLRELMTGFKGGKLGNIYAQIRDDLADKFKGPFTPLPFGNLNALIPGGLGNFGLVDEMNLIPIRSLGDGMCGEHSLFIPTDGPLSEISEGNGRDKILRAIKDNAHDPEARRLYLYASKHMDGGNFTAIMTAHIRDLRGRGNEVEASALKRKLIAYQALQKRIEAENEIKRKTHIKELRKKLLATVIGNPTLRAQVVKFNILLNDKTAFESLLVTDSKWNGFKNIYRFRNIIDEIIRIGTDIAQGEDKAKLKQLLAVISARDEELKEFDSRIKKAKDTALIKYYVSIKAAKKESEKADIEFKQIQDENNVFAELYRDLIGQKAEAEKADNDTLTAASEASSAFMTPENKQLLAKIIYKLDETKAKKAIMVTIKDRGPDYTEKEALERERYGSIAHINSQIAEEHDLIARTLNGLMAQGISTEHTGSASIDGILEFGISNFINVICQEICTFSEDLETAQSIKNLWDSCEVQCENMINGMEGQLKLARLEIVESLQDLPLELTQNSVTEEMVAHAKSPNELSGWLPCDSSYIQLWAIINNLNVFVFSGLEGTTRPKLDVLMRGKADCNQKSIGYEDLTGNDKRLCTVILTSPTAKNVFLDKRPAHYNKFIEPGDYAAMAKAQRHLEWIRLPTQYAAYPKEK